MPSYIDPFTGLKIEHDDELYQPMYYVCTKHENLPGGHKAMGIGIAHALFDTKAEAIRYQLQEGIASTTYIEVI